MTAHQYGTLKYILEHNIFIHQEAKGLSMSTVGSLIKRKWLTHKGGLLTLTDDGIAEFDRYKHPHANFRKYENDVSDYVKNLLHINRLSVMRRAS